MEMYIGTKIIEAEPAIRMGHPTGAYSVTPLSDECARKTCEELIENHGYTGEDGYKVRYADGYESWSPKAVFEEAYKPMGGMNFGLAIEAMRKGFKVRRRGWNGKGIHIELQVPDANSKMTSPYIFIDTTGLQTENQDAPKSRVPWLASQTDMLAEDWELA